MRVIREISRGGFGIVEEVDYKGERYARKIFQPTIPDLVANPQKLEKARQRFRREIRIQKEIDHRNIMPILDENLDADPPWFLMPLAEEDYTSQIERDKEAGEVSLEPLLEILAGLEELHRLGYVHRDLKPQNVLLLDGRWVLSDFGLILPTLRDTTMLTSTDSAWGTELYAAPEIVHSFRNAPPQADIFSFGCMLHDIVGTSPRLPYAQATGPRPLGAIIEHCTAQDPADRFADIAALRSALVVSLVGPVPTVETPQVENWIEQLTTDPSSIDKSTWEQIVRLIERDLDSSDANALLNAIDIPQLEHLQQTAPLLFARLVPLLCRWIRTADFAFAYCDVLGARLKKIYQLGSVREKAEATIAAFVLGCSHNRWFVMRTFRTMASPGISEDLAERLAIDLVAMGRVTLYNVEQIERAQIGVSKNNLHPRIQRALEELEAQYGDF
ncbi:MAG: serine/threonine protein kinase [Desulfobacterales bacterium]|nr:serine/threonine protein kinase [Desulfobacterales bacterium]